MPWIDRGLRPVVEDLLGTAKVVLLRGARQVGKSTLAQHVVAERQGISRTLDDPTLLAAARTDPIGFLTHDASVLAIDEVQRAPELILPLKLLIDQRPDPGRYLLTGSSDLLRVPGVSDSLAGRTATAMLRPLTQGELAGRFDDFIDRAMSGDTFTHHVSSLSRANYVQRALDGGFPGLSGASNRTRRTILDDYSTAVLYRSLNELSSLTDPGRLPRLLRLLAARSSQEINRSDLARDLGSAAGTIDHLLDLLMTMHLLEIIPSWSTNRTARTVRRPKSVLIDTALICNLLGIDAAALDLTVDPKAAGPILESFVINELLRQAAWSESRPVPAHYRTHDGAEIDLILETPSGKVMAIEIKTSAHVTARDIGAMTAFAEKHQSRFIHGFVLYTGTQRVPFGPRITALPIDALWCGRPS